MHNYREEIQHYITYIQNNRIKALSTSPFSFICVVFNFLACVFLCLNKCWWELGVSVTVFLISVISVCCIKGIYNPLFYKIEFLGVSLFCSLMFMSNFLANAYLKNYILLLIINFITFIVMTTLMHKGFIKKIKKDYYKELCKTDNSANSKTIGITATVSLITVMIVRLFPKNIMNFFVGLTFLLIASFLGAAIFMRTQKIYFVLKYKLELSPDIE